MAIHLTHTFTGSDSTTTAGPADTGQVEVQAAGVWGRSSNQAYSVSTTGICVDLWDGGHGDGAFSVDMTIPTSGEGPFLVFRATDANNLLMVQVYRQGDGTGTLSLFKRIGGTFTTLGSTVAVGALGSTAHALKVVASGTSITVYYDGTQKLTYAAATGQEAATKVGIGVDNTAGGHAARFDNLSVADAAASGALNATLPPLAANFSGGVPTTGDLSATLPSLTAYLAGEIPVTGTLAATLPALGGALVGTARQTVDTDPTYSNEGYNYDGTGEVTYDPPVAPDPPHIRRTPVRRVHQSLPAPTLVDGRPT